MFVLLFESISRGFFLDFVEKIIDPWKMLSWSKTDVLRFVKVYINCAIELDVFQWVNFVAPYNIIILLLHAVYIFQGSRSKESLGAIHGCHVYQCQTTVLKLRSMIQRSITVWRYLDFKCILKWCLKLLKLYLFG